MTDTNYVAVPRELSDSVLERVGPINDYDGTQADADHRDWWATVLAEVAAPPAASGRARELVWDDFSDHVSESKSMPRYRVQSYDGKWVVRLSEPFTEFGLFDSRDAAKAEAQWRWDAYVRSLLAPAVDERAASSEAAVVVAKVDCGDAEQLSARITEYLRGGGLWNPECANHDNVRKLLIDCRNAFDAAIADHAIKAAIAQVDAARTEGNGNG